MFEIMSERDALLEEKNQNDDWWHELDFWLNKRKSESKQIDIDRVLNFIEDLKREKERMKNENRKHKIGSGKHIERHLHGKDQ
ncbi:hypothetical protein JL762_10710 [Staphylococcus pseudintermedius]|nr:hypothetical protein [Staphylococcus pseudintermedius]